MHFIALLLFTFFPASAHAMTFSPPTMDIQVEPGAQAAASFSVGNTETTERTYSVSLYGVTFDEETGDPIFAALRQDLQSWVAADIYEFSLVPGASRAVTLNVNPPATMEPDTFVVGVVVREANEDNALFLSSGFSSLAFVTVGSPIVQLDVQSLRAPLLVAHPPVDFSITVANSGERVGQPFGLLRLTNTFGASVDALEVNPTYGRVPQGVTRSFAATWGDATVTTSFFGELWRELTNFRVGLFTAEFVGAPYPGADLSLHATTRFLVFPWRLALLACVVCGAVFFVRRRGQKRW